jgi:hypothetical protein
MSQNEINDALPFDNLPLNDLSKFKESILLVFKEMELKLESKYSKMEEVTQIKLLEYENKLHAQDIRLKELHSSVNQDKIQVDKIESLMIFQRKTFRLPVTNTIRCTWTI